MKRVDGKEDGRYPMRGWGSSRLISPPFSLSGMIYPYEEQVDQHKTRAEEICIHTHHARTIDPVYLQCGPGEGMLRTRRQL